MLKQNQTANFYASEAADEPSVQFIEEVQKYDFLYNLQNKDYRDQRKRLVAWEEIGRKLNKTGQECRDSWTKLRNSYTNALKRRRTTLNGQPQKRYQKWRFEDEMAFLSPHMEHRAALNDFHYETEYNAESQSQPEENVTYATDMVETQVEEDGEGDQPTTSTSKSQAPAKSNDVDPPSARSFAKPASKKRTIEKSMGELVDMMKLNYQLRSQIRPLQQPASTMDGDAVDSFFLSLAKTVKCFPHEEQARLKMAISNLVFEAELRHPPVAVQGVAVASHSTAPSNAGSYSNDSEIFVLSPSALGASHNGE